MKSSEIAILAGVGLLGYVALKSSAQAAPAAGAGATGTGTGLTPVNYGYQYGGGGGQYYSGSQGASAGGGLGQLLNTAFNSLTGAMRSGPTNSGSARYAPSYVGYNYNYGGGSGNGSYYI